YTYLAERPPGSEWSLLWCPGGDQHVRFHLWKSRMDTKLLWMSLLRLLESLMGRKPFSIIRSYPSLDAQRSNRGGLTLYRIEDYLDSCPRIAPPGNSEVCTLT